MDFNGTSGQFTYETSGGATGNVLSLSANTWYEVTIALNITTHTFTGTITPQSGSATPFSAAWRISTSTLNRFVIDDVSGAGQNGTFSSTTFR